MPIIADFFDAPMKLLLNHLQDVMFESDMSRAHR